MNKCDHIIAMHYHYDMLINESEKSHYIGEFEIKRDNQESYYLFKYCPECGTYLK